MELQIQLTEFILNLWNTVIDYINGNWVGEFFEVM